MKWPDKDVVHEMFWWLCVLWQPLEKILFMNINVESKDIIRAVEMTLKWENVCSLLRMWRSFFLFIFNLVVLSEIISNHMSLLTGHKHCQAFCCSTCAAPSLFLVTFESITENIWSRPNQSSVILGCQGLMRASEAKREYHASLVMSYRCQLTLNRPLSFKLEWQNMMEAHYSPACVSTVTSGWKDVTGTNCFNDNLSTRCFYCPVSDRPGQRTQVCGNESKRKYQWKLSIDQRVVSMVAMWEKGRGGCCMMLQFVCSFV